jgi:hypothetical protein
MGDVPEPLRPSIAHFLDSNFGRESRWVIERHGQVIAALTEPRPEDMFWYSYRLEPLTDDPDLRQQLLSAEFWAQAESQGLVWRNREFGEAAEQAFPALSPFPEPGRLKVRGLYLTTRAPWPWDGIVLWLRHWWRRRPTQ